MLNRKILVVSEWGPPMIDGPSIILGNLLREFDKDKIVLFTRSINQNNSVFNKEGNALNVKRYSISVPSSFNVKREIFKKIIRLVEVMWIPFTVLKGLLINYIEKADLILATSDPPHVHFLLAAYFIARIARVKLVLYLFDPVEEFGVGKAKSVLLERLMPRILKYASKVMVMNEFLAGHYESKFRINCEVLPHSMPQDRSEHSAREEIAKTEGEVEIIFSGKLSQYQEDSLLNLKRAIELIPQKVRLKIYSSTPPDYFRKLGFNGSVAIDHLSHERLIEEIRKADILFLPLSFKYSESMIVKSAFPAKTMDYLRAMRPILIHAPADSFIVSYARKNAFAVCVAENDIQLLVNAIQNLIADKELRIRLINNCRRTLWHHDPRIVHERFVRILEGV